MSDNAKETGQSAEAESLLPIDEHVEEVHDEQGLKVRHRGIYLLPNLFTTAALFSGFYAIINGMSGHFENAAIAIFVAMVLDGLDGRVARMTNTQSAFGAEYDSLSDMVAFGVAPALLAFAWALGDMGKVGWMVAFIYVAGAALRLARFNTQVGVVDKRWFIGLNSPSSAGLMASFVWVCSDLGWSGDDLRYAALAVTVAAALLMVSRIRYNSFKGSGSGPKSDRVPFFALLIVVVVLIALAIDAPKTLLTATLLYALSGPVLWFRRRKLPVQGAAE